MPVSPVVEALVAKKAVAVAFVAKKFVAVALVAKRSVVVAYVAKKSVEVEFDVEALVNDELLPVTRLDMMALVMVAVATVRELIVPVAP